MVLLVPKHVHRIKHQRNDSWGVSGAGQTGAMPREPEELTETEQARYRAARSASEDLRAAVDSGDPNERSAAFGQLMQALSAMHPDKTCDKIHLPDDAEGYEDGLRAIMMRIPDGWGRWISCDKGWYPIITGLDRDLAAIDPDYELHQVKEKYAGLRYYFRASDFASDADRQRMKVLINEAETRCERTCELCGAPGTQHTNHRCWLKTLCSECATAQGYDRIGELVNDLTPEHIGIWKVTDYAGAESIWDMSRGEVSVVGGEHHRNAQVIALPSVLRAWRLRLTNGTELESELIAAIERVR